VTITVMLIGGMVVKGYADSSYSLDTVASESR
jgi:hypothetical protein